MKSLSKYLSNNQMYISIGYTIEAYIKQNDKVRKLDIKITEGHIEVEDLLGILYIGNVYDILDGQGIVKSLLIYNNSTIPVIFKCKTIQRGSILEFKLKEELNGW